MALMFDDVNLDLIPKDAWAVAGYVNGKYQTFPELKTRFPQAKHFLSIAVTAEADAECLDVERFDATPDQAPAWVRRQHGLGVARPAVYCSLSDAQKVTGVLAASGIKRNQYRLITAHYTGVAHLCSKSCGYGFTSYADATQYTDKYAGKSLDASFLSTTFFDVSAPNPIPLKTRLRTWIFTKLAEEYSWKWIKQQAQYKLWRKLGGK